MADVVFTVPEEFEGMSLSDLRKTRSEPFQAGIISEFFGIGERDVLEAGKQFEVTVPEGIEQSGSAEFQFLNKLFNPISPGQFATEQAQAQQQEAIRPAVESLQAGIPETEAAFGQRGERLSGQQASLQERYSQVLGEIKGREERAISRSDIASGREFGARGLTAAGPGFEQFTAQRTGDIRQGFGELASKTGFGFEDLLRQIGGQIAEVPTEQALSIRGIRNAIAQLQAGAGSDAITQALAQQQFAEQQRQFDIEQQLASRGLDIQEKAGQGLEEQEGKFSTFWESLG